MGLVPMEQKRSSQIHYAGSLDIVRITDNRCQIIDRAWQLRTPQLDELKLFRVIQHIMHTGLEADPLREFDQTRLLQQLQASSLIDRIIRNPDPITGFDLIE